MQLHEIKSSYKPRKSRRIGRGGKRGTYSGHGLKGQRSRSGRRFQPIVRELIKRYPKLRGYRHKSRADEMAVLNLEILEKKFEAGVKVNPEILMEKRLIRKLSGKTPKIKILSRGKITKALNIENCQVSKIAKEKIEKAGGTVRN